MKFVSKKLPQEKSNHKVVVEIRMSQSEESNSITVGNHNLNLSIAAELTGKYVKLLCEGRYDYHSARTGKM